MAIQYRFLILAGLFALFCGVGFTPVQNACAADGGETDPLRDGPDTAGGGGSGGGSGTIAKQTCDTQVWRTMEARARLETEREMMQNQNLIFKPDSILTYTCFDSFASHAANTVGPLFTHTTYFEGKEIIPSTGDNSMGKALQKVVIGAMKPYISGNFDHDLLGGRGRELSLTKATPTDISGTGSTYSCGKMAEVWSVAKCMNFLHTANFALNDGFYPFINLTAESGGESVEGYEGKNDTRKFPTACGGTPVTGSSWKEMYRTSRNETDFGNPNKVYQYGNPLNKIFTDVRKKVEPNNCGQPAIKTGVKVILSPGSTSTYEDGVCTNPGCSFDKSGTCKATSSGTPTGRAAGPV